MGIEFTQRAFSRQERSALFRLLADNPRDIILKLDRGGFIVHASAALEQLGILLPDMLIGPHLLDLVHPACASTAKAELAAAIDGRRGGQWIEFQALNGNGRERWFEIRMRSLADEQGEVYGTLCIMRSIDDRRAFEDQLFAAAMTDPLTSLTNRAAFIAMLQHLVDERSGGCLALFEIDHLKAINLKHGHSLGDRVLVVFADFLRGLVRPDDIVSRVGGARLGILFPSATADRAEAVCQRIIATLSQMHRPAAGNGLSITASAGVARIAGSLDNTMKRAEMALFFAKANGRNRLEMDDVRQFLGARA